MNVEELFISLSNGELSNLSLSNSGSGTIDTQKHPKLIGYINDALTRLYGKFLLKESDLILQLDPTITLYNLLPEHTVSNGDADDLYILDTEENPFLGDVVKVLYAYDAEGNQYALNDPESTQSLNTPQPLLIQVPEPKAGVLLHLLYQANHPYLNPSSVETLAAKIELPGFLHEALKAFVAYKVFSHMNGQENAGKAAEHMTMFDNLCEEVVQNDLVNNTSASTNRRFKKGGWV